MSPMAGITGLTIIVDLRVVWREWSTLERHVIWHRVCSNCIWCLRQELPFLKSRYVVHLYSVHLSYCISYWLFKYLLSVTSGVLFNKNNKASMKYICDSTTKAIIVVFGKLQRLSPSTKFYNLCNSFIDVLFPFQSRLETRNWTRLWKKCRKCSVF